MCKNLRKVIFTLGRHEFDPDANEEEIAEMERLSKERKGYFHRWVEEPETSKDIPYVKTMALVEDVEDGSLYNVETYLIKFSEE